MNVLLIGGGGREHAIAWKLRQSPLLTDMHIAPGNAGTALEGNNLDLPLPKTGSSQSAIDAYMAAIVQKARELRVDLVFVAPDDPLSWGLVDRMQVAGIAAFGPSQKAAQIEASKAWAKDFAARHDIPHTRSASFEDLSAARAYVQAAETQLVIKADGLAVGKGVTVTSTKDEATETLEALMSHGTLGAAGRRVVIEERVHGREVSGHAFSDGRTFAAMPLSCDHKAVFDGDQGPNTGGMGIYSPPWWADEGLAAEISQRVLAPTIEGMRSEGTDFAGILYPGIFVTPDGINVFEYNARFGDPEAQALLPRLKTDLLEIVWAAANRKLHEVSIEWQESASVCVVLASGGYPGEYRTGLPVTGLPDLDLDVQLFHAGTKLTEAGEPVTAGGRVLNVVAMASTLEEARLKAYANIERIHFEGMHFRRDIGR